MPRQYNWQVPPTYNPYYMMGARGAPPPPPPPPGDAPRGTRPPVPGGGDDARTPPAPLPPPPPLMPGYETPSWWTAPPTGRQSQIEMGDWLQQYVTNALLPALDPFTAAETAQWLARDNPQAYGAYADVTLPQGAVLPYGQAYGQLPTMKQFLTSKRLGDISQALDYDTLLQNLPASIRGTLTGTAPYTTTGEFKPIEGRDAEGKSAAEKAALDLQASLRWMQEALQTAQMGVPGATRRNQLLAAKHLDTLMQEAEAEPLRAGRFKTLLENILNPVTERAPLSGVFGVQRAIWGPPADAYRRGGLAYKNPIAT